MTPHRWAINPCLRSHRSRYYTPSQYHPVIYHKHTSQWTVHAHTLVDDVSVCFITYPDFALGVCDFRGNFKPNGKIKPRGLESVWEQSKGPLVHGIQKGDTRFLIKSKKMEAFKIIDEKSPITYTHHLCHRGLAIMANTTLNYIE